MNAMSFHKSRYRPRSYSYRRSSRYRRKNYKPLVATILGIILIGWLGYNFFAEDEIAQSAEAVLQIKQGTAEFALNSAEKELWTRADSGQKLLQGDKLRTGGTGIVVVDILGSSIFLKPTTEIEFSKLTENEDGEKNIEISLKQGEIWAKVVEDDFTGEKSSFVISAKNSKTYVQGTIFDILTSDKKDIIRIISGQVNVDIKDHDSSQVKNLVVGEGQKLEIDETTYQKVANDEIVLEINDKEFIQSEWNLKNLEQFKPQEAQKIRGEIENSVSKKNVNDDLVDPEIEPPVITSPQDGEHIPASEDMVIITGTVPENIFQVSVNGYTLTKFQPGDRKWSYFASKKFGTMVPGENKYSVKAIRRDGKESKPTELTIFYDGFNSPQAEDVARNFRSLDVRKLDLSEFKPPEILKPFRVDPNQPYQTSSEVVVISGIVDPKTNRVEVNGFQLRKFKPGDTDFSYIANAKYGNMKVGENVYEVVAFGPDGKKSSSSIKIIYTPLEL